MAKRSKTAGLLPQAEQGSGPDAPWSTFELPRLGWWWLGVVIAVLVVAMLPSSITIVDAGDLNQAKQAEQFDADEYVDGIWDDELLPAFDAKAKELGQILSAIRTEETLADADQLVEVVEQYGLVTAGEAHVYLVSGTGSIVAISDRGIATVELDGYGGPIGVEIYLGTRIPSDETSVRDGVGFINFGDFREQTEYGMVGSAINRRIVSDVITPLVATDPVGKRISFEGAFGIRTFNLVQIDLETVRIVPVSATVIGDSNG